jgi:hypothetical protein
MKRNAASAYTGGFHLCLCVQFHVSVYSPCQLRGEASGQMGHVPTVAVLAGSMFSYFRG